MFSQNIPADAPHLQDANHADKGLKTKENIVSTFITVEMRC